MATDPAPCAVTADPELLGGCPSADRALAALAAPVRAWFEAALGRPTPAQLLAWPAVAAGRDLLVCAPTGTGKTLAAFLPLLGELFAPAWPPPGLRGLYVAPLKALGNDARKNLVGALKGIERFLPPDAARPRVGLRSGDTSAAARRQLWIDPPDILLTTPESLAVLLCRPEARDLFASLRWAVIDEVHALAASKRGCDLALSLERLTEDAGGRLQRIGLSATCTPAAEAARFLAGTGRPCALALVRDPSPLELTVEALPGAPGFLAALVARVQPVLAAQRGTLIFTNTRGLAERLSWALRRQRPDWDEAIAVHHSSLAAGRRHEVECGLKSGRLRAVVCSTSLELGIDIGPIDGVVLVHPPGDVVRLLQRVGRSGHGPGRPRRGLVLAAGAAELLEAAVTAASGRAGECEPLHVPDRPLDVLCQHLLGLASQPWTPEEALVLARRAYPYRDLTRDELDACLDYLSGRHRDGQPWLPPRLTWEGAAFRLLDDRTARLVRRNLGTIVAEPVRAVRLREGPAVGEVDEAFADRLQPGERFLLDGRCLEYQGRDGPDVLTDEVVGRPATPRWGAGGWPLSPELARRLYLLRARAALALRQGPVALAVLLAEDYALHGPAQAALAAHFQAQECQSEIPGPDCLLVEQIVYAGGCDSYLHTALNRAGNDALARVAVHRLARDRGRVACPIVADLGLVLSLPGEPPGPDDLRTFLTADRFGADLAEALADSATLRERFQRVATTGLMLLRQPLGRRRKVGGAAWGERRLFEQVRAAAPDFILLQQAEREVRQEACDEAAALAFLHQLPQLMVRCRRLAGPSPFAEGWTQADEGPGGTAVSPEEALQKLHAALMGIPCLDPAGAASAEEGAA